MKKTAPKVVPITSAPAVALAARGGTVQDFRLFSVKHLPTGNILTSIEGVPRIFSTEQFAEDALAHFCGENWILRGQRRLRTEYEIVACVLVALKPGQPAAVAVAEGEPVVEARIPKGGKKRRPE